MANSEIRQQIAPTPESETQPTSEMRVYPMGFIPEVKHKLLESLEKRRFDQGQEISKIGSDLKSAATDLQLEKINLGTFFDRARALDDFVKDGEQVFEEEKEFLTHILKTDEEIAVIFAKISRNSGSFDEISRSVTEEGASEFHQKWTVTTEGYGHASVAEHAIIHMAIENVPSLDGDYITDSRLASFTEFSARFKGRQGVSYYTPESIQKDPYLLQKWDEVHKQLFAVNDLLTRKGLAYIETEEAKQKQPRRKVIPKTVADQFKDLMPASRLTSIGATINAREVENSITKFLSAPYPSTQKLGELFKEQSLKVSPTLVKYANRNEYLVAAKRGIGEIVNERREDKHNTENETVGEKLVDLIDWDKNADDKFIAAALYNDSRSGTYREILNYLTTLSEEDKRQMFDKLLGGLERHDVPLRALEIPGDYLAEFPGMTYGIWREYHRHRIQSYQIKDFDVRWGYMIPPLVLEMDESNDSQFHGSVEAIKKALGEVDELFTQVSKIDQYSAHYLVTRLHYRPAISKFNIREVYHLIDLRTGPTAHPFIRQLMWPLFDQIRAQQPILMSYLRLKMSKNTRPNRDNLWTF